MYLSPRINICLLPFREPPNKAPKIHSFRAKKRHKNIIMASMEVEDHHSIAIEMPPPPAASSSTTAATAAAAAPFQFDLEAYISRYESLSETRLQRLLFLASTLAAQSQQCTDPDQAAAAEMARQAYRMAEAQCRDACNGRTYRRVFGGHFAAAASGGEYFFILDVGLLGYLICLEAGKKDINTAARKGRWYLYY